MNKQQKEYAIKRIDELGAAIGKQLRANPSSWIRAPLSHAEIWKGVTEGTLVFLPFEECVNRSHWNDSVSFKDLNECLDLTEAQKEGERSKWYLDEIAALKKRTQQLKDRIMLGDAGTALEDLRRFEAEYGPIDIDE